MKKSLIIALAAIMLTGAIMPAAVFADKGDAAMKTVADWKFDASHIKSGSIAGGDLVIADASGGGNDLVIRTYGENYADYASVSDESMTGSGGSIFLNGNTVEKQGIDFVTVDGAPVNKEEFRNGYTIEIIYKLPGDWTVEDRWTSLISRLGDTDNIDREGEDITAAITVSNCKEIQAYMANADDNHYMTSAAWSVSMDNGDTWYHIAVTSDNHAIRTYVNGCEAFRDYISDAMTGLLADPSDGRFRIGNRVKGGVPYRFTRGNIQEIRISSGCLDKSDWLVPDAEKYISNHGSNADYPYPENGEYTFVFLPDIQNEVKFKGDVLETGIQYLADNADKLNLSGVICLGDVVQDMDDGAQWVTADRIMNILPQSGVKLLMQPGNHDYTDKNSVSYVKNFGPGSRFLENAPYVTNDSPSNCSSYMTVTGGGREYLVISLEYNSLADSEDTAWFENVLKNHPDMPTIVTSHDVQNCSPTSMSEVTLSARGKKLWEIVKKYPEVFLLYGGHSHGAGVEVLTNDDGGVVYSVLADYQFAYNGGNSFFHFAEFDEANNMISIRTFSPYANSLTASEKSFFDVNFLTGDGNELELPLDFKTRFDLGEKISFSDLPESHWAHEAVASLVKSGVIGGYADGTFLPDRAVTRAELAKMLTTLSGVYDKNATSDFADVAQSAWYAPYVASAKAAGIINGYADGTFKPNDTVSRADLCVMVYRAIGSPKAETDKKFADDDAIPDYAKDAVYYLYEKGVVGGVGGNRFDPSGAANRAAAAKILYGAK